VTGDLHPPPGEERLVVGLVRGLHGLRGAVRVEVLTDNEERFMPGSVLFREGSSRRLTVASVRRDGPGLLVRFREIRDRDGAEELRDAYLEAPAAELPGETYYWHEIVGCAVSDSTGRVLGRVEEVFRVGEAEVYVVRGEGGELLVPAVSSVVTDLAPGQKRIVVDERALGLGGETEEAQGDEAPG
jgi:16S rRNA processing protein RimM